MERRIRRDHPNYELRHARVRVARKPDICIYCGNWIGVKHVYARTSETRLPVCSTHFTPEDVTNGPVHPDSASDGPRDKPRRGGTD